MRNCWSSSWPGLSRPSTPSLSVSAKSWMPAFAGMTSLGLVLSAAPAAAADADHGKQVFAACANLRAEEGRFSVGPGRWEPVPPKAAGKGVDPRDRSEKHSCLRIGSSYGRS